MIQCTAPDMLQTIQRNQVREPSGSVWEPARLFVAREDGLPLEKAVFALASWAADEGAPGERFLVLVQDVRALLARLGVHAVDIVNAESPALDAALPPATWLHPGRTAHITHAGSTLAVVGEVLPAIARRYDVAGRAALAEIDADALLAAYAQGEMPYEAVLRYPVVPFDVAVIVPRTTPAADVQRVMQAAVADSIRGLHVFDVYEGDNIPAGARSLALRCELFDRTQTLSTKAADALRKRVTDALTEAGWTVRAS